MKNFPKINKILKLIILFIILHSNLSIANQSLINKNSKTDVKLIKNYLLNKKKNNNPIQIDKIELTVQKLFKLNNIKHLYTFFTTYKILKKK